MSVDRGDDLRVALCAVLGDGATLVEASSRRRYARDASTIEGEAPVAVCLPSSTEQVVEVVRLCREFGAPFVTRGAGTGLAGGAVPLAGAVVISTMRLDAIHSIDVDDGVAWVGPGVLNLDLNRVLAARGYCFAPDPSSQQACTVGGNVANNSGGPHCLAEGVTSAHIAAIEVVLPDASVVVLGGVEAETDGFDLRGLFVGSEGMLGVACRIAVRLTPLPPASSTLLAIFDDEDAAAAAVSAIIAGGTVPGALEMIDGPLAAVLDDYAAAGFPHDAAAVLLIELEGTVAAVDDQEAEVRRTLLDHRAREVRGAVDADERARWWKARKSAFGAIARIRPDYYLHDTVVPRRHLVRVLSEVRSIAAAHDLLVFNVFHAGDGNLHPLLLFDAREPGVMERVHAAGDAIVAASLAVGGVLSGEHGIGLEKRGYMDQMFGTVDLEVQEWAREAIDPERRANPHKVLPTGSSCGDLAHLPDGVWI